MLKDKADVRIVFMGTPLFAASCLQYLVEQKYNIVGVVTVPDKPSGRGLQLNESEVKKLAVSAGIPVLQPEKLKSQEFLDRLNELNADLFIVVAFRMLPEVVWKMPKLGTFNLHASLLPQYRGAAPINWAIINGDKTTGVTTFFIKQEIDTGGIILQDKIEITESENAGSLHDKLIEIGKITIAKTIDLISLEKVSVVEQELLLKDVGTLKLAPKIFKDDCKINWNQNAKKVYDLIRGLSPYPAAFTYIKKENEEPISIKIFEAEQEFVTHDLLPGTICTDSKKYFKIAANDGFVNILSLQAPGKKKMDIRSFLMGFKIDDYKVSN